MACLLTGIHVLSLTCPPIGIQDGVLDPARAIDLRKLAVCALGEEKLFALDKEGVSVPDTWDLFAAKETVVEAFVFDISDLKLDNYTDSVARPRFARHFLYSLRHRVVSG